MNATVANMRKCKAAGIRAVMLDPYTGETYSADPDDYVLTPDDAQFVSGSRGGGFCELVTVRPAEFEPIADDIFTGDES